MFICINYLVEILLSSDAGIFCFSTLRITKKSFLLSKVTLSQRRKFDFSQTQNYVSSLSGESIETCGPISVNRGSIPPTIVARPPTLSPTPAEFQVANTFTTCSSMFGKNKSFYLTINSTNFMFFFQILCILLSRL